MHSVTDEKCIPAEWRALERWLVWDKTPRKSGDGKPSKKPLCARDTNRDAKVNDPSTWSTWDEACRAAERLAHVGGVGFVLGDDYFGVDLDHVLVDGELVPGARQLVESLSRTWTERSPSGTGLHLVFRLRGTLPADWRKQLKGAFGPDTGLEAYGPTSNRYFTVTGDTWCDAPIADLTESDIALLGAILSQAKRAKSTSSTLPSANRNGQYRDVGDDVDRARFLLLDAGILDHIVDDYDDWLRVLAALRPLGDAGLTLAEEWSRRGKKFVGGDVAGRWPGLRGSSINTLFGMADDADQTWRSRWHDLQQPRNSHAAVSNTGSPVAGAASKGAPRPDDTRPRIHCALTEFHELLAFAQQQLAMCDDLACEAGRIVHVVRDDRGHVLRTVPLPHGAIRERLSCLALWLGGKEDAPSIVNPPEDVVHALAETRPFWDGVADIALDERVETRDWLDVAADPPLRYLVSGAIPRGANVGLVGMPNQGKSAVAIDISLRLVHGMRTWLGRDLPAGGASTLYLAAEGAGGLGSRLRAWVAAHPEERPADGHYFAIRAAVPNLAAPDAAALLHEIIAEVARQHDDVAPDLIVVDTLSGATPGADENDAGAASAAGEALAAARRRYGCATMVLHHFRKLGSAGVTTDAPRAPTLDDVRGSSVVVASADVILAAHNQQIVTLKVREGVFPSPAPYSITSFETERTDEDGRAETGPVVLPAPSLEPQTPVQSVEANRLLLVAQLDEMEERAVEALRRLGSAPNPTTVVAEMLGRRSNRYAAFGRAVAKGRIINVGSGKTPRYIAASVPGEGGGVERTKDPVGNREPGGSGSAGSRGSGSPMGTDGNREPVGIDDGVPEKPKGRRKSRRKKA